MDKPTRRELEAALKAMEEKIDNIKLMSVHLEGKKRAELADRVKSLESNTASIPEIVHSIEELQKHAVGLETRLSDAFKTLREVVASVNSSATLLGCIERYADAHWGDDWDEGIRAKIEERVKKLRRRREIMLASREAKGLEVEAREALAVELWELARDLDTRAEDAAMTISLHLQSMNVDVALDVTEELARDDVVLEPGVAEVVQRLVDRCREIAVERKNDLAVARVKRIPTLVDPRGKPISAE